MTSIEREPKIAVARSTLGLVPDKIAFSRLDNINHELGINLLLELNPHRLATIKGVREFSQKFGIEIIGVHGPLQARSSDLFMESIRNISTSPPDPKEALLELVWFLGFGGLKEPRIFKRYGSHMELARQLHAYLVMHQEPLEAMGSELVKQWARTIKILRENGWGPKDARPNSLSWDPKRIKEYADAHGIGTLLDTATAARAGQNILQACEIMQPAAIHFSDRSQDEENLIPGKGDHSGELRELVKEVGKREGIILVIEVSPKPDVLTAIAQTLEFIEKYK